MPPRRKTRSKARMEDSSSASEDHSQPLDDNEIAMRPSRTHSRRGRSSTSQDALSSTEEESNLGNIEMTSEQESTSEKTSGRSRSRSNSKKKPLKSPSGRISPITEETEASSTVIEQPTTVSPKREASSKKRKGGEELASGVNNQSDTGEPRPNPSTHAKKLRTNAARKNAYSLQSLLTLLTGNTRDIQECDISVCSLILSLTKTELRLLEFHQVFELVLWPACNDLVESKEYVLAVARICLVKMSADKRFLANLAKRDPEQCCSLIQKCCRYCVSPQSADLTWQQKTELVRLFIYLFGCLESPVIRGECMRLVGLSIWHNFESKTRLELEFEIRPQLRRIWSHLEKKWNQSDDASRERLLFERSWLSLLIQDLMSIVSTDEYIGNDDVCLYVTRVIELLIDLESQLPTRRYVNALLKDHMLIAHLNISEWIQNVSTDAPSSSTLPLFKSYFARLKRYVRFEVDDHTGTPLTESEATMRDAEEISRFQKLLFQSEEMRVPLEDLILTNVSQFGNPEFLREQFLKLSLKQLHHVYSLLGFDVDGLPSNILVEHFVVTYERRQSRSNQVQQISAYPDEKAIWDINLMRDFKEFDDETPLSVPKLNLQFLTVSDYLQRNFELYRSEQCSALRLEVEDALLRMGPRKSSGQEDQEKTLFSGWSRMAIPLQHFRISATKPPLIGDAHPSRVEAELAFSITQYNADIRKEWDSLRRRDTLYLISIQAPNHLGFVDWNGADNGINSEGTSFDRFFGIKAIRGCEVIDYVDENGDVMMGEHGRPLTEEEREPLRGTYRTVRVHLDPIQYHKDLKSEDMSGLYTNINVLLRRKPHENNGVAVLETIRDLMTSPSDSIVPDWLHGILLGYGDPSRAHYSKMINERELRLSQQLKEAGGSGSLTECQLKDLRTVDFRDTFLVWAHLESSFEDAEIEAITPSEAEVHKTVVFKSICAKIGIQLKPSSADDHLEPPYVITFLQQKPEQETRKKVKAKDKEELKKEKELLSVSSYGKTFKGPFSEDPKRQNDIRFTAAQVEAIRSGSMTGLTLVIGPPGTGKTDVAVQILSNIYHNSSTERTLVVTHSNQALNQLFEKLVHLDVDQRHLLRLGHGEAELDLVQGNNLSYGKQGRVGAFLEKRLELLSEVSRLSKSMSDIVGDVSSTCETAENFYSYNVKSKWQQFLAKWSPVSVEARKVDNSSSLSSVMRATLVSQIIEDFPFAKYFESSPSVVYKGTLFPEGLTVEEALTIATGCWNDIERLFEALKEIRAFELIQSNYDRSNYLLIKEARIIAMTTTHAAIKRKELVSLGFKFENVLMEESSQVLEIETFIPLTLQKASSSSSNQLQRLILIGDHHQLPPVVKAIPLQKYANFDQSMFYRMIRLGVSAVQLDAQGRCRTSLRSLYSWCYPKLDDLPVIRSKSDYQLANPGFAYEFQAINVEDYQNQGETSPLPHFMQNLGEAEYVVAVYQYMRLLGYPAHKIVVLTPYNGQRELINEIIQKRCVRNPLFGRPSKVTTVDKFQGQQNDYVLLSLVRTKNVGHLRDIRRLVVSMSRARLGLYVFCRASLFQTCYELHKTFSQLSDRPLKLELAPDEKYQSSHRRSLNAKPKKLRVIQDVVEMGELVYEMTQQKIASQDIMSSPSEQDENEANEMEES